MCATKSKFNSESSLNKYVIKIALHCIHSNKAIHSPVLQKQVLKCVHLDRGENQQNQNFWEFQTKSDLVKSDNSHLFCEYKSIPNSWKKNYHFARMMSGQNNLIFVFYNQKPAKWNGMSINWKYKCEFFIITLQPI